jgi:hypothetical protein
VGFQPSIEEPYPYPFAAEVLLYYLLRDDEFLSAPVAKIDV